MNKTFLEGLYVSGGEPTANALPKVIKAGTSEKLREDSSTLRPDARARRTVGTDFDEMKKNQALENAKAWRADHEGSELIQESRPRNESQIELWAGHSTL